MQDKLKKVSRLEVIDENGRSYVKYGVEDIELSFQDDNTTLKLFLKVKEGATIEDWKNSEDTEA